MHFWSTRWRTTAKDNTTSNRTLGSNNWTVIKFKKRWQWTRKSPTLALNNSHVSFLSGRVELLKVTVTPLFLVDLCVPQLSWCKFEASVVVVVTAQYSNFCFFLWRTGTNKQCGKIDKMKRNKRVEFSDVPCERGFCFMLFQSQLYLLDVSKISTNKQPSHLMGAKMSTRCVHKEMKGQSDCRAWPPLLRNSALFWQKEPLWQEEEKHNLPFT